MWLAEVSAKAKRHNQILFSKESLLLDNLRHLIDQSNRRALTLWALELAEETVLQLTERYLNLPEQVLLSFPISLRRKYTAAELS